MPKFEVEILSVEKFEERENPIITLKAKRDFNIARFLSLTCKDNYKWNLEMERNDEIDSDVVRYFQEHLRTMFEAGEFVKFVNPISRFIINYEKKCVFLQIKNEKITIKCDEEDKFDWKIGLGLAISKLNDNEKYKQHREFFRNKKTRKLDVKKYSRWVLNEFYGNDMFDLENLELRVKNAKDKEFIDL